MSHQNKHAILSDDSLMPFGKHRGLRLSDVPADYFHWLWQSGKKHDKVCPMAAYIRRNIAVFEIENPDLIWD